MEKTKRNEMVPLYGNDLQQRMYAGPNRDGHEECAVVFALIEHVYIVERKIHKVDLRMLPPQLVTELVHMSTPPRFISISF